MRNLKELFQVVLNNQDTFNIGLCGWIYDLCKNGIISREESIMLKYYIANSPRPSFKLSVKHINNEDINKQYYGSNKCKWRDDNNGF